MATIRNDNAFNLIGRAYLVSNAMYSLKGWKDVPVHTIRDSILHDSKIEKYDLARCIFANTALRGCRTLNSHNYINGAFTKNYAIYVNCDMTSHTINANYGYGESMTCAMVACNIVSLKIHTISTPIEF